MSRLSLPRSESELKRLRAYEGLAVLVIVVAAVLLLGSAIAVTASSSLSHISQSLGPGA